MSNVLLERAAHTRPAATRRGALERLFTLMFKGFVYNQIWEDPVVDLEAMALRAHHRVLTIASAGCNVLNYLAADPGRIIAVDLNPNHVALTRLKLAALEHLPDYDDFFRFFGEANSKHNDAIFDRCLKPHLDADTRGYWETHVPLVGRRIEMFSKNLYRHGLLGRFITALHVVARLHGRKLTPLLEAQSIQQQRAIFEREIAPLFASPAVRLMSRSPVSLYALGIPPAQYDELVAASDGDAMAVLRRRVEKLACDFPVGDNYFAWQAFGHGYDTVKKNAVPPYLRRELFGALRARVHKAEIHHASLVDFLRAQPANSLHRFVLLDAQDWMTPSMLAELWAEIDRTADMRDARVIFRTAGEDDLLPRKLGAALLAPWVYRAEESRALHARDRSSIYGGFHLYERRPLH